ncbi:MAG: FKBP-type peptidyl-prolyl cis-trans isomerase [Planctomycetota bacterium]|jgi:FKBP-type peptidyl-prolyl cis-trans isomerase
MRQITSLGLAFLLAGFMGCSTPEETGTQSAAENSSESASTGTPNQVAPKVDEAIKTKQVALKVDEDIKAGERDKPGTQPTAIDAGKGESTEQPPAEAEFTWSAGDTIPSGMKGVSDIQILQVHKNGSGDACGLGKSATLKYKAMLANGTVIDPGRAPFTFKVGAGRAIKGWDVVVSKMRVGDSFTILLPQQLAYGASKGDLKFDMELLSVK